MLTISFKNVITMAWISWQLYRVKRAARHGELLNTRQLMADVLIVDSDLDAILCADIIHISSVLRGV
jgi:hypothetical protein